MVIKYLLDSDKNYWEVKWLFRVRFANILWNHSIGEPLIPHKYASWSKKQLAIKNVQGFLLGLARHKFLILLEGSQPTKILLPQI